MIRKTHVSLVTVALVSVLACRCDAFPFFQAGNAQDAELHFNNKAEALAAEDKCSVDFLKLNASGMIFVDSSKFTTARSHLRCMQDAHRYLGDYKGELSDLTILALIEGATGKLAEELATVQEVLRIAELHGETAEADEAKRAITEISIFFGTPDNALTTLEQFTNDRSLANHPFQPQWVTLLAGLYARKGDFARCTALCEHAEDSLKGKPRTYLDQMIRPDLLNNLGVTYAKCRQYDKGLEILKRAGKAKPPIHYVIDKIAAPAEERLMKTTNALAVALVKYDKGDRAGARQIFERYLPFLPDFNARVFATVMHIYQDSDPAFAIIAGKQAVNLVQGIRQSLTTVGPNAAANFVTWNDDIYRELAAILINNGRFWEAIYVLDLLKEREYNEFIGRGDATGEVAIDFTTLDGAALVKIEEEEDRLAAKERLTAEETKAKAYLDAKLNTARVAAARFFDINGRVKVPMSRMGAAQVAVDEQDIALKLQRDLRPNQAAIFTLVAADGYHALLVTDKLMVPWFFKISRTELRQKVFAFYQALKDPFKDPLPKGKELFDIVVGDLNKELKAANVTAVLWSLNDVLRYIPMAALHDGQQYMIQRFSSVVYNKLSGHAEASRQNWKVLGAGVSEGNVHERLGPLSHVPAELRAIVHTEDDPMSRGIYPGKILLDPAFTATAFRARLHQDYSVVHIASHFVFNPASDAASFLLLGDGKLSLAELRKNPDYSFRGIQLLTLSACETAAGPAGDGEEIDGLGFLAERKGANAVVATLWSVNDESTTILMAHFYEELNGDKAISKAEALRRAQEKLLNGILLPNTPKNNKFNRPFFWAPFILLGNSN